MPRENSAQTPVRVIVCGGRDFTDRGQLDDALADILPLYGPVEIVSGHARGADMNSRKR